MPPRLTPHDAAARNKRIIELWNKGLNSGQLANRFRMDQSYITTIIAKARKAAPDAVRAAQPGKPV